MDKYGVSLSYNHNLIRVDGEAKKAWFNLTDAEGNKSEICKDFDMLHVCPVQQPPAFISESGLSDQAGWLSVDPFSLPPLYAPYYYWTHASSQAPGGVRLS